MFVENLGMMRFVPRNVNGIRAYPRGQADRRDIGPRYPSPRARRL